MRYFFVLREGRRRIVGDYVGGEVFVDSLEVGGEEGADGGGGGLQGSFVVGHRITTPGLRPRPQEEHFEDLLQAALLGQGAGAEAVRQEGRAAAGPVQQAEIDGEEVPEEVRPPGRLVPARLTLLGAAGRRHPLRHLEVQFPGHVRVEPAPEFGQVLVQPRFGKGVAPGQRAGFGGGVEGAHLPRGRGD